MPVFGFEGLYEVSDRGRVRSLPRDASPSISVRGKQFTRKLMGKLLSPSWGGAVGNKYLCVKLWKDGEEYRRRVHILVLEAFVSPRPSPSHLGLHWDDDPSNNQATNLRWGTSRDNQLDRVRLGTNHNSRKTHCYRGHEYNPENTYISIRKSNGREKRYCRKCSKGTVG